MFRPMIALTPAGFTTSVELSSGVFGSGAFGKRQQWTVDGAVQAQPLYAPGIVINGGAPSNLLLVVTEHATLYALDAGDSGTAPQYTSCLLPICLTTAAQGVRQGPSPDYTLRSCGKTAVTGSRWCAYLTPEGL